MLLFLIGERARKDDAAAPVKSVSALMALKPGKQRPVCATAYGKKVAINTLRPGDIIRSRRRGVYPPTVNWFSGFRQL
ncbi:hypothetical protein KCP76_08160 [Salmonella enterica subsp. enterica serovar Weltevreden]|nr:hypothetical protein KCP76_08160 [Salmonella enterica subsp. enterica serovar Weltevreden]